MNTKRYQWMAMVLSLVLTFTLMSGCGKDGSSGKGTVPLTSSAAFTGELRDTLLESSSRSVQLESMQLDMLFNPAAEVDPTRSNSTYVKINLENVNEPDNTAVITTESLHDAKSGDASFTISMGQGQEQVQGGGVYFVADNMLIKRGSTEKKMVSHSLNPSQTASLKNMAAIKRLGRVMEADPSDSKTSDEWSSSVDAYIALISQNTQESDYSKDQVKIALLADQTDCGSTLLTLKGEKAQTLLLELVKLLQQNSTTDGMFDGVESSGEGELTGLALVQSSLEALTAEELAALELSFTTLSLDGQSLGYDMQAKTGEKTLTMKQVFYTSDYERHNEILLKTFDGITAAFFDKNVSAGGDKYQGEASFKITQADGTEASSFKAQWNSVQNDDNYSGEYTFTSTAQDSDEGGLTMQNTSGQLSWTQKKSSSGDISGSGQGEINVVSSEGTNKLRLDISLQQKYADVTITPPQFIASAGIVTTDRDQLLAALEIDQVEFDDQSILSQMTRGLVVLIF